jgi:hypothetical protein
MNNAVGSIHRNALVAATAIICAIWMLLAVALLAMTIAQAALDHDPFLGDFGLEMGQATEFRSRLHG